MESRVAPLGGPAYENEENNGFENANRYNYNNNANEYARLFTGPKQYKRIGSAEEWARAHGFGMHPGLISDKRLRGIGSYGAVISPAVDNIVNGRTIQFPNKVTKLLYNKNAYNKTLHNIGVIKEQFPELAYNIDPYERTIFLGNIDDGEIFEEIQVRLRNKGLNYSKNAPLYGVRMNDMGHSLGDVYENSYLQSEILRNVSLVNILKEMKRVANVVKHVNEKGYLHGDIREANMLCNIDTGRLQLIDFDFLIKKSDITRIRKFYAYPMELYYYYNRGVYESIINMLCVSSSNKKVLASRDIHASIRDDIVNHYKRILPLLYEYYDITTRVQENAFIDELIEHYKEGFIALTNEHRSSENCKAKSHAKILNSYITGIDTVGLGVSFLYYIVGLTRYSRLEEADPKYKEKKYTDTFDKLIVLIQRMITPNFMERYTIDNIIKELDTIIDGIRGKSKTRSRRTMRRVTINDSGRFIDNNNESKPNRRRVTVKKYKKRKAPLL